MENLKSFILRDEDDLVDCRTEAALLAFKVGFNQIDRVRISTAVSEIARNAIVYAGGGEVILDWSNSVLTVTIKDFGPGIDNVEAALRDGYSTSHGLGIGLAGSQRLMDSFVIESKIGEGTTVVMTKELKHAVDRIPEAVIY